MVIEVIMVLMLSYQLIVVPYVTAFLPKDQFYMAENKAMVFINNLEFLKIIYICLNILQIICFMIDGFSMVNVLIHFNTGYFSKSNREIVLDRKRIIWQYIKTYFILDALASIPIEKCLHYNLTFIKGLRDLGINLFIICALLKFCHVPHMFAYMRNLQTNFLDSTYTSRFFRHFFALVIFIHWLACLRFLITRWIRGDDEELISSVSWVQSMTFLVKYPHERYIMSLYNVLSAATTYSSGIALSYAHEDIIFIMVLYLVGYILKMIITSKILLLMRNTNASKLKYQTLLQQLKEFMRHKQLPSVIRNRLLDYYEFKFQKNFYKEDAILNTLSTQLRQEIILYSCRRLVVSVPFFYNIPNSLLVRIVSTLRCEIFLAQVKLNLFELILLV